MSERHSSAASPQDTTANSPKDELRAQLDQLLTEVCALALRLRQDARRVQIQGELPAGGHNVLRMLGQFGALTVPQIARLVSTSRQNIQTVVNRLQKEGCVESAINPAHKRSGLLRLTERGVASLEIVSRHTDAYKEKLLPHLSEVDLTKATELLRVIHQSVCEVAPSSVQNGPKNVTLAQVSPGPEALFPDATSRLGGVQLAQTASEENELPVSLL